MRVIVLNAGSSTLKFDVFDGERRLLRGLVDRVGMADAVIRADGLELAPLPPGAGAEMGAAAAHVLGALQRAPELGGEPPQAVGHRVVHGGQRFSGPARIDDAALAELDALSRLAPLHNPPALSAIRAARAALPEASHVAVFDTSFHASLPEHAARYPIDVELADRHQIRRYGFHGLAHRWMAERCAALTGGRRFVTLQLGNGCSAAAVRDGRSLDTTMGLTPLEGLMMGTRCGDVDPTLARFLGDAEGLEPAAVEDLLCRRSGLAGVSGVGHDMRQVLAAADRGVPRAELAVAMYCHRVRKAIGAYLAVLEGAEAIAFGGGVGEHAAAIRERCLSGFGWAGLELDHAANAATSGAEARISTPGSRVAAYVIPVDEGHVIAREVAALLGAD